MKSDACCDGPLGGFKVEAVLSVDGRGQIILPKEFRDRVNLESGEKLALVSFENQGELCCMCLIKVDALAGMVRQHLGPMVNELVPNAKGGH